MMVKNCYKMQSYLQMRLIALCFTILFFIWYFLIAIIYLFAYNILYIETIDCSITVQNDTCIIANLKTNFTWTLSPCNFDSTNETKCSNNHYLILPITEFYEEDDSIVYYKLAQVIVGFILAGYVISKLIRYIEKIDLSTPSKPITATVEETNDTELVQLEDIDPYV